MAGATTGGTAAEALVTLCNPTSPGAATGTGAPGAFDCRKAAFDGAVLALALVELERAAGGMLGAVVGKPATDSVTVLGGLFAAAGPVAGAGGKGDSAVP